MEMSEEIKSKDNSDHAVTSLKETSNKVKTALLPAIDSHVNSEEFSRKDGLDFLDVKNSLLLSYLIDLTVLVRNRSNGKKDVQNMRRLVEMKTVLDKMRGLDKKLRYQIEKLLAASTSASTFASGGDNDGKEDPLQFRPDPQSLEDDKDSSSDMSEVSESGDNSDGSSDADDDLAAARATLSMAKERKGRNDQGKDGLYRAPRLAAVPYAHDLQEKQQEKEKRNKKRLRATELAQTLRAQYGDAPDQEDIHGGSDYGRQRAAARRMAERQAEKTRYEEEAMVRLTTTRKEKKERKRQMQQESSNLSAIADLGNLVRETQAFGRNDDSDDEMNLEATPVKQRYDNGKRRREHENIDGKMSRRGGGRVGKAKNSLQAALYNTGGKPKKKKSRK